MTVHTKISYLKSLLRIFGFGALCYSVYVAAGVLIVAEVLGVFEELPGAYKGTVTRSESEQQ